MGAWNTRDYDWRMWEAAIHDGKSSFRIAGWMPLPFVFQHLVDQSQALLLAVLELLVDPRSSTKREHLRSLAANLRSRCNRLTHRLNSAAIPS
jgi:hypothetical protein